MSKSENLKAAVSEEYLNEVCRICKEGEDIAEATEKDICAAREKIATLRILQQKLNSKASPTAYLYLERMIFCLSVKNVELGKTYNHVAYLYGPNNIRASTKSVKQELRRVSGNKMLAMESIEEEKQKQ